MMVGLIAVPAWAEPSPPAPSTTNRTDVPEEEDFTQTPFTEYGEFNEQASEDEDTRFFQYGRFFGVSLGAGYEGATGNRGLLWEGGFPTIDIKVHYWFDFNFALDLGITTASHSYQQGTSKRFDVNLFRLGIDLKYYFETHNLSAPLTFAGPYLIAGAGSYSKTESDPNDIENSTPDSSFGFCAGAGLEFVIKPKKSYFALEGKFHSVSFKDTYTTNFQADPGLPDLTGMFYTVIGSVLFTW